MKKLKVKFAYGNHFRFQHSSNCESKRTYIAQDTSSRYIAQEYIF